MSISKPRLCRPFCQRSGRHLQLMPRGRHNAKVGVMHDAGLDHGLVPDRADGVGQALEAVADQHEDVAGAAVLDLAQYPEPELGALAVAVLPGPQPQDVPLPVHGDAQGQVNRPVGDLPSRILTWIASMNTTA